MSTFFNQRRLMIPRWREFITTSRSGELSSIKRAAPQPLDMKVIDKLKADWKLNPSPSFASNLISSAFVLDYVDEEIRQAAKAVIAHPATSELMIVKIAKRILGPEAGLEGTEGLVLEEDQPVDRRWQKIKELKNRLQNEPRNAILWTEIARHYVILGQIHKANHALGIALKLAPDNRFVLRAASRFFIHTQDPEQAIRFLRRTPRTKFDPWLLSTEIAVAQFKGQATRYKKQIEALLFNKSISKFDLTELASSFGTLELEAGNPKKARKLFQTALLDPNENTVAQAVWVKNTNQVQIDNLEKISPPPRLFEAEARKFFFEEKFDECLNQLHLWHLDQPFSIEPLALTTFVTSEILENYQETIKFAHMGLKITPHHPVLINNLIYAMVQTGELFEAEAIYKKEHSFLADAKSDLVLNATKGLLEYRKGNLEAGKTHYLETIEKAKKLKERWIQTQAWQHLALEEMRIESKDWRDFFDKATQHAQYFGKKDPAVNAVEKRLLALKEKISG